jgi:septum formation protein
MAKTKAQYIAELHPESYVIGSDTIVTLGNQILGKPTDKEHALEILRSLQGKTHQVITGLAVFCLRERFTQGLTRTTEVTFGTFSDAILHAYITTGEPLDKAGAYGIQGKGSFLVKTIKGSCSNVIGLPVNDCTEILLDSGVITPL